MYVCVYMCACMYANRVGYAKRLAELPFIHRLIETRPDVVVRRLNEVAVSRKIFRRSGRIVAGKYGGVRTKKEKNKEINRRTKINRRERIREET